MVMLIIQSVTRTLYNKNTRTRQLWHWLNIVFNNVDKERRKEFGPDRTCAEWLLRNGGQVKWQGVEEYLGDYNLLPPEGTTLHIEKVDASGSSIMHYGFPHFVGCKHIKKIILHDCGYLQDEALGMMTPLQDHLKYVQVSKCGNITETGLLQLKDLANLETLILFDLPYVTDKERVVANLKRKLPNCTINFK